jgi:L-lactate dehydrogenase complex protein LldE
MKVGLFIPCYVDAFHPEVGIATLELLERLGLDVDYPFDQTCCGQPMTNAGCHAEAAATEALFVKTLQGFDYIVTPSGSCTHPVRCNLDAIEQTPTVKKVRSSTYDLVEFLHDIVRIDALPWAVFPHRIAYHHNCNALRGIYHASMSELREEPFSKPLALLSKVKGVELAALSRPDECCGFGGTFSVFEAGVSAKMGHDKVQDQARSGAEYVVSADSSCLMHQQGCAERVGAPLKYIHIAQVLNGARA